MPESPKTLKKRLLIGYAVILILSQLGLPLFYLFFGIDINSEQISKTILYFLLGVPLIGGIFSIYIPLKLFKTDTSYPKKVAVSNAAGIFLFYAITAAKLKYGYNYPMLEIMKLPFIAFSIMILQCLGSYMFTQKTLFRYMGKSSGRKFSLYYKNLLFITLVMISIIIITGVVAFNQIVHPILSHQGLNDSSFVNLLLALLLVAAIVILFSIQFSQQMILPLKELAHSVNAISSGAGETAKTPSGDEVEDLLSAFNLMVEKVTQREGELMLRGQYLALLYTLAEALNQNKTTEELFDMTMTWFDTAFGFEVGALRLYKNGFLKLAASRGIEQNLIGKIEIVKAQDSISGAAALKKNVIIIDNISAFSSPHASIAKELGLECLISIPLQCRERLIGTLSIGTRIKRDICPDDANIFNSVGNLIGIALERSTEFHEIEEEKFQWETAINHINDLISVHDNHGKITMVNSAFLKHFCLDENEVLGKHCYEIFHGTSTPHPECPQLESLITRKTARSDIETPDGKVISVYIHPKFKDNGAVDGTIHIVRDVTEIRNLRSLIQQADKLSALGRLSAGIAHNVNNPLTYSLNYLFILKEMACDEKTKELIEKAKDGIEKSRDVLKKLLDLSMPSEETIETVDIKGTIMETLSFLSAEIAKNNILINTKLSSEIEVKANRQALEEVLLNLITNSIDAAATEITIETHKDPRDVTIIITDNGEGIDKEHLDQIFEPYFTTKPKDKGTGLGLYVSYNIIKSFNGNLWCRSKKGTGTMFFILLPYI